MKKFISRRDFLKLAGAGTFASLPAVWGRGVLPDSEALTEAAETAKLPKASPDSPNILVIVVDALRADHLSGYGYHRDTSPFIDSLAKEGVHFERAISASSWTQPSHASMLTGRYTYEHQAETKPLDRTYPTIGEVMQANGYRTGAFSGNTLFFTRRQGFGRGFLHFEDSDQSIEDDFINSSLFGFLFDYYGLRKVLKYEKVPGRRYADDITRSILKWVDRDTQHPFFVFVNYFDTHDPYLPPEPYRNRYTQTPNPGGLINTNLDRYSPPLTPDQLQSEMDAYDGAVAYVDDHIKILLDELRTRGMLENTIVVFTSDHGESFGEHGLLRHSGSLYIEQIHVPLIFWWPGHIPAGRSVDLPVTNSAIATTILSLIDSKDNPFPAPSLTSLILNADVPTDWPRPISELAQLTGSSPKDPSAYGAMKSVVDPEMQYIVHEKFGEELYNWPSDRQEANNLIHEASSQSALSSFRHYLQNLITKMFKIHET